MAYVIRQIVLSATPRETTCCKVIGSGSVFSGRGEGEGIEFMTDFDKL